MRKPKIALLVNQISPSRVGVYERLASALNLIILHGEIEGNRDTWKTEKVNGASNRRIAGWQLSIDKHERGEIFDRWFLHLEPGYIIELIRERPDGVITFEMGFRTLVALAYGACFRKPVWIWWGGTPHTERRVGRFRKLLRVVIRHCAKHWISYGQTSTEYLVTLGIPPERILQVQNCVDETWYGSPTEPALDVLPRPVLLHVGQMIARKGIAEFLRAAARLQQEGLTFSIVLVGGGRDSAKLQRLAVDLRLNNVRFYPAQPPKAMPAFYRGADALVFPTMTDVWGLVANEAILSGLPVLCSDMPGARRNCSTRNASLILPTRNSLWNALRRTVMGELPRADKSRLRSSADVGDAIAKAVLASCAKRLTKESGIKAGHISRSLD